MRPRCRRPRSRARSVTRPSTWTSTASTWGARTATSTRSRRGSRGAYGEPTDDGPGGSGALRAPVRPGGRARWAGGGGRAREGAGAGGVLRRARRDGLPAREPRVRAGGSAGALRLHRLVGAVRDLLGAARVPVAGRPRLSDDDAGLRDARGAGDGGGGGGRRPAPPRAAGRL